LAELAAQLLDNLFNIFKNDEDKVKELLTLQAEQKSINLRIVDVKALITQLESALSALDAGVKVDNDNFIQAQAHADQL